MISSLIAQGIGKRLLCAITQKIAGFLALCGFRAHVLRPKPSGEAPFLGASAFS